MKQQKPLSQSKVCPMSGGCVWILMFVEFLGTGISQGIPVINCQCDACQSQNPHDKRLRSSVWIMSDAGTSLLIDIGPDFRYQALRASIPRVDALLVTHEHSDHVAGLDDIRPFNWILGRDMPLYAHSRTVRALQQRCGYAFLPPEKRYPGAPAFEVHALGFQPEEIKPFQVNELVVQPLPVQHGPLPILGYRVANLAYITDCSSIPESTLALLQGVDTLIINALRPTPHPMHYSLEETLQAIAHISPSRAYLTHLSHEYGPIVEWESQLPSHVFFAYDTLRVAVSA